LLVGQVTDGALKPRPTIGSGVVTLVPGCRFGDMLTFSNDIHIGPALQAYGEWFQQEIDLLRPVLARSARVVDAGGNIGTHALAFAALSPTEAEIWSFEPQPEIHALNAANAVINGYTNIRSERLALGAEPDLVQLLPLDLTLPTNFGGTEVENHSGGRATHITTLDEVFPEEYIDLLKIDVQGMEAHVLHGGRQLIHRSMPVIYIENEAKTHSKLILGLLIQYGYRAFWHHVPAFNSKNFNSATDDIFQGKGYSRSIIAVHASSPYFVEGLREVTGPDDWWTASDIKNSARKGEFKIVHKHT
jgi:FkbM family methyltransferase